MQIPVNGLSMIGSNSPGILQCYNDAAVNARDRNYDGVFDWTKHFEPVSGELFRHGHIVPVNSTKHHDQQRNDYHHNPSAMYELGSNKDTKHDEGKIGRASCRE